MAQITPLTPERRKRSRSLAIMAIFGILIILMFIVSMNTGFIRLSPLDLVRTLFGAGTDKQQLILFEFRLPRIVLSLLIGAGLAVSGCIMQGISAMRWPTRAFSASTPAPDLS